MGWPNSRGSLNPFVLSVLLSIAAVLGDTVNYWIGRYIGPRVFRTESRFLNRRHLARAQEFYERHGGKAIVFARFVPDERIGILKVDGVVQIISNNGVLSPIPDEEIESIRTLVDSELAYDPVPLVKEGDMVRVAHGPLKGVVGRLVRKGAHARLVLSVDLIGQAVSVEVDAAEAFAPVKNSDEEATDNPRGARSAMMAQARRRLREAGVRIADDIPVEINPLWAATADEIRQRLPAGTAIEEPTYFSPDGPRVFA